MFPFHIIFAVVFMLIASTVAAAFGLIGGGTLVFIWIAYFSIVFGVLLMRDGDAGLRRAGVGLMSAAVLGLALALGIHPAHAAEALIATPPGDTGLWAWLNPYLAEGIGTVVAAFATWALKEVATHTRIKIRADQEAQIRETMKTAAYAGAHELELFVGDHWTPAQQAAVVKKMRDWAEVRAGAQLRKLGLPNFVVEAMAHKVLGQVMGLGGGFDAIDAGIAGTEPLPAGNPGETPLLARLAGA